ALDGWIFTWQRISDAMQLGLDLQPLQRIHAKLDRDMPISQADIKAGLQALQLTRRAFRNSKRSTIAKLARDAQIAILAAEKGKP
ncbi:MAG TPA: hypothetical protein VFS17_06810, partial [Methylophilaceae bacterium]|nr:hypothetical protein [Methylophilaceae bacterium]